MEKKQNFMRIFLISMIWKSGNWSLHNTLISQNGQNAEKQLRNFWLFFKLFSGLSIWKCPYILIKQESCLSVCVFICSRFPKSPKVVASWNFGSRRHLGLVGTWRSPIFEFFYGFYWLFSCFLMGVFVLFFSPKISAILTPRTMKFGHKDYSNTKQLQIKKNSRAFFRYFFHTQIKKWCVCSWFPQPSNIRAAWNLEFK